MDPAPWAGLPVVCVPDRAGPGLGPLAGLDAALAALRPPEDAVLAVGGDMPFLAPALIELLRDHPSPAAALVPWYGGHPQPLLARYTLAAAPAIAAALRAGRLKVAALPDAVPTERLDEAELRAVDPALASFLNVNTPDDLARARALAGG
jgi:molybdopterin-guanine dinucleotide biosynthesis protein A